MYMPALPITPSQVTVAVSESTTPRPSLTIEITAPIFTASCPVLLVLNIIPHKIAEWPFEFHEGPDGRRRKFLRYYTADIRVVETWKTLSYDVDSSVPFMLCELNDNLERPFFE